MSEGMPVLRDNDYVRGTVHFYLREHERYQRQIRVAGDNEWYTLSFGTFNDLLNILHEIDEELHTVEVIREVEYDTRVNVRNEEGIAMFIAICGMC